MSANLEKLLDETGWRLLDELQKNARLTNTELGQRVGLTSPAVADRIRRMEDAGIIVGYRANVDLEKETGRHRRDKKGLPKQRHHSGKFFR